MTKICSTCKVEKALEEFHNSAKSKDGKKSSCKSCIDSIKEVDMEVSGYA